MKQAIAKVFLNYDRHDKKLVKGLTELCLGKHFDFDTLMENIFKVSDLKVDPWSIQI